MHAKGPCESTYILANYNKLSKSSTTSNHSDVLTLNTQLLDSPQSPATKLPAFIYIGQHLIVYHDIVFSLNSFFDH